jgi:hypothetical protein
VGYHLESVAFSDLVRGCGRIGFAPLALADSTVDGAPLTYRDAVLADHPVAYWRLDDNGVTASDVMGSYPGAYSGTCMHGVRGALTADPDTATNFEHSCIMSANNAPSFAGIAAFTIELWFQPTVLPQGAYLVMKETRTSNAIAPIDGYAIVNGTTGAYFERCVAQTCFQTSPVALPSMAVHHLVATYDGAKLAFYLDGALAATKPDSAALNTTAAAVLVSGFTPPPGAQAVVVGNPAHSRRPSHISMVETADLRHRDNGAALGRFDRSRFWRIFHQREMRSSGMIIVDILRDHAQQMTFVEHDDVVEALPA